MTTLEAVQEISQACGLGTVPALDTDGPSRAGQIERVLDRVDLKVQLRGWHFNKRKDVALAAAFDSDVVITVTAGAWTHATKRLVQAGKFAGWTPDSTKAEYIQLTAGTGVTAGYAKIASKIDDDEIELSNADLFTADNADTTATNIGTYKYAVPASAYGIDTDGRDKWRDYVEVNGFLFDRLNNTNVFDTGNSVRVRYLLKISFSQIPQIFAEYITAEAAFVFNNETVRVKGQVPALREARDRLWVLASQAETDASDVNMLETDHARLIHGRSDHNPLKQLP